MAEDEAAMNAAMKADLEKETNPQQYEAAQVNFRHPASTLTMRSATHGDLIVPRVNPDLRRPSTRRHAKTRSPLRIRTTPPRLRTSQAQSVS